MIFDLDLLSLYFCPYSLIYSVLSQKRVYKRVHFMETVRFAIERNFSLSKVAIFVSWISRWIQFNKDFQHETSIFPMVYGDSGN